MGLPRNCGIAATVGLRGAPDRRGKSMARTDARSADGAIASSATAAYLQGTPRSGPLKYTPGFLYILALFVAGEFLFSGSRGPLVPGGGGHPSFGGGAFVGAALVVGGPRVKGSHLAGC